MLERTGATILRLSSCYLHQVLLALQLDVEHHRALGLTRMVYHDGSIAVGRAESSPGESWSSVDPFAGSRADFRWPRLPCRAYQFRINSSKPTTSRWKHGKIKLDAISLCISWLSFTWLLLFCRSLRVHARAQRLVA